MHAAAPLQLSLELTKKADTWANQLANQDKEKIDVNSKYGQNIFSSEDQENLAARCVRSWYNGIRFYDFHTAKSSLRSEYFTQLVWVASQEVGISKAISASGKTYVVALFDPPGNKGEYLHNVKPVSGKKAIWFEKPLYVFRIKLRKREEETWPQEDNFSKQQDEVNYGGTHIKFV